MWFHSFHFTMHSLLSLRSTRHVAVLLALGLPLACSQKDPADADDQMPGPTLPSPTSNSPAPDSGTDQPNPTDAPDPSASVAEYFPLVDGASWTYQHEHPVNGQWVEEVSMRAGTHEGQPAFIVQDTPNRSGETTTQWWQQVGTQIMRVFREERGSGDRLLLKVVYTPGFQRFDTAWTEVGAGGLNDYLREETKADGRIDASRRQMDFVVVDTSATIEVPAGTFEDCLHIERKRRDNGVIAHFWYAKGVGKVYEEDPDTGAIEKLTAYTIPER